MIAKSWFSRCWQWQIGGCVALVGTLSIGISKGVLAQIVPDTTLGAESSVVTPNLTIRGIQSDRIDGGATRGANLFHSFQNFNVREGRGAYFANPTGIENILTRVTGGNPSNILGRLGVLGGANLFLLNPNGIIFGPNASLDIQGSFLATTADRIQLGDSGYFSAAQPQTSSLLAVSPGALFFDAVANQSGSIINRGNLSTGKHLTLAAGNLDLQGQLQAGGDLTLQAQDTVKVRDSVATPFIASAGGNLLVQGNQWVDIFALNHPESGLFSGGDMVLRSSNTVGGDAHYWSKGSFRIEQLDGSLGNLFSPHDPIMRVRGDVFIQAYRGASLHILAGGKVEIPGSVRIQGADPENGLVETVNLADGTTVSINGRSEPTLDIRAGVNPDVIGEPILTLTGTGTFFYPTYGTSIPSSADIKIGTILFADAASRPLAGRVLLTNQYQPNSSLNGDIQVTQTLEGRGAIFMNGGAANPSVAINSRGSIILKDTVNTFSRSGDGGAITLTAQNNITTGNLSSYSNGAGNGGAIALNAPKGSITTGNLYSRSFSSNGNAGQGGAISLTAANDINITGDLYSYSRSELGNASQGGEIGLKAGNGSISTGDLYSYSYSRSGNASQGGEIGLMAANGIQIRGNLDSSSSSNDNGGDGGAISLKASNGSISTGNLSSYSYSYFGKVGNGGAIGLRAGNDIQITGNLRSDSFSNFGKVGGQGGEIGLKAGNDIQITGDLRSYSYSVDNAGNAGAIGLNAGNDIQITGNLSSFSNSFSNAGNAGAIGLNAGNDIQITGNLSSSSSSSFGNAGQGGTIGLKAANDITITGNLNSYSVSARSGNAGQGGAIGLTADNDIFIKGDLYSFSFSDFFLFPNPGNAGQGGAISLIATSGDILGIPFKSNRNTEVRSPVLGSFSISQQGTAGSSGKVALEAKNSISNLEILTLSSDSPSGTVQIIGLGDLLLTNTNILTSKQVRVQNPLQPGEFITLNVGGKGQSGNVDVTSSGNLTFNNSSIQSDTKGSDNAGNVTVNSPGLITFNHSFIRSNTSSAGAAGSIGINAGQGITLVGRDDFSPVLSVETSSAGQAGSIMINTPSLTLSNNARITATATKTATNPQGGGSITLNASTMNLAGVVGVFAETQGQTPAGTLTLQPYENQSTLNLTLAPESLVSASTSGSGKGGNLIVQAPAAITIRGAGQLAVKTTGEGAAGDLRIETQRLTIADGAIISASTFSENPNGGGGNLTINATESFNLMNRASLLAQSTGAAPAGNITIYTGKLTANNGTIATSSEQSSGGSINITASNIRLFGNSDITSRVNKGANNGGNIYLKAGSILAFGDSDILAFAPDGSGGNIYLDTRAFFGQNYRPAPRGTDPSTLDNNNRVDVNATGAVASGTIILPDTTFIQNSLSELPANQIDTNALLANSCIVRRNQPTQGSFTITGAGGLPQRPGDVQMSSFPTIDVETLPSDSTSSTTNPNRPWQKGDPIVEPQGVYRLSNGKLVMSRECP